jgi:hypothetical protein
MITCSSSSSSSYTTSHGCCLGPYNPSAASRSSSSFPVGHPYSTAQQDTFVTTLFIGQAGSKLQRSSTQSSWQQSRIVR